MAEDKKYFWLKLKRDFFKRHDIRIIESMPDGKEYVLFYVKLMCESIDHEGALRFSEEIPYTEDMLATITNTDPKIVKGALEILSKFNMVDLLEDGTYTLPEAEKMVGSETYWAEKKREQKKKKEAMEFKHIKVASAEMIILPNGKRQFVDEKRYGGNGKLAFERAEGKCEICGSEENLCIHHNNGYSNELDDLVVCCKKCHGKLESQRRTEEKFQTISNDIPTSPSKSIEIEKELDIDDLSIINKLTAREQRELAKECGSMANFFQLMRFADHQVKHRNEPSPISDCFQYVRQIGVNGGFITDG